MTIRKGRQRPGLALVVLLAATMAIAGCTSMKPQQSPRGEAPVPPAVDVAPPVTSQAVAVFFPDWQVQHGIPEERQVAAASRAELATQVVRELLAGPADPHLLRPFPAGVTLLEPVTVEGTTARVNLSKEIQTLQSSAAVAAATRSIRLSLTEIEGIDRVQILIEGQSNADLGGLVLGPMDRGLYLYPVLANPERVQYLQTRYDQGLDPWRADPLKVAQWEGRMFGFTAAELQGATVATQGRESRIQVTRNGMIYAFTLGQNQTAQGAGVWSIQALDPLVRHTLGALPASVRAWADLYTRTTVGVSRQTGDRTYLLAAVEEGAVQIDSVAVKDGQLVVYVVEAGSERVALASLSGEDALLPVAFQWKSAPVGSASRHTAPDALPRVVNPHGLPDARLTGEIADISPTPDQTVTDAITVQGYARHLFEAHLAARLLDAQGHEVAAASTTAGACCFDWGSFKFVLKHGAPAGVYRLELGTYSPKDGEWKPRVAIPVKVAR